MPQPTVDTDLREDTTARATPTARSPRRDLLCALAVEHRDLDALARRLTAPAAWPPTDGRVDGFLHQLTLHELAEEVLLDPLMRTELGSTELADRRGAEQRALLTTADRLHDTGARPEELRELHDHLVEHSDREELEVFPQLRHVLSPEALADGWQRLQRLRDGVRSDGTIPGPDDAWSSTQLRAIVTGLLDAQAAPGAG